MKYSECIDTMFNQLVSELSKLLPDYGKSLAFDGKAVKSYTNSQGFKKGEKLETSDGRKDENAD